MDGLFKEKEEVKEYIKNLGIQYRFSCYSEKNAEGCQLLADYLSQIDHDYKTANKILKENCDLRNLGRSCTNYGLNLLEGRGCIQDYENSVKYFSKACELEDATGCDFAGKLHTGFKPGLEKHVKLDPEQGLRYLERGCNIKSTAQFYESSESCFAAAFLYGMSNNKIIPKDFQKAIEFGTKACERGIMNSCKLVSNIYKKLNNEEMYEKFLKLYNEQKKQITDHIEIEMQRS